MTLTLPRRLLIAGALCLLALVGLVISEARARAAGREVILAMEPIDPRSILTGHYVILNFTERLAPGAKCPSVAGSPFEWTNFVRQKDGRVAAQSNKRDAVGWVALKPQGDRNVVVGATKTRSEAEKLGGDALVRGWATCNEAQPDFPGNTTLHLAIDRFHTSQREAQAIEKAMRDRTTGEPRVLAILSIGADGTPRTKGLIVDGKRIELRMF